MLDIGTDTATSTVTVCETMALFGAAPERGERDSRVVWDEDDATEALSEAIRIMVEGIAVDGTQMADEREPLMWGLVNMLHSQVNRLDRAVDRLVPEIKDMQRAQDGSEIAAWELELATEKARNLGDRRDAFEKMRDIAANAYLAATGDQWRPRAGSHTSQTGALTSAAIDARDFVRARKDRETRAHLPEGTLVAVTGGKQVEDPEAVWSVLDKTRAKHPDIVILHGGRTRRRDPRRQVGRGPRRRPGRLPPRLDCTWQGRALQAQRRAAEPDAEGRSRLAR